MKYDLILSTGDIYSIKECEHCICFSLAMETAQCFLSTIILSGLAFIKFVFITYLAVDILSKFGIEKENAGNQRICLRFK